MFSDSETDREYFRRQQLIHNEPENPAKPGHIYMDHMGFGMGNSCLQVANQIALFVYFFVYLFVCLLDDLSSC